MERFNLQTKKSILLPEKKEEEVHYFPQLGYEPEPANADRAEDAVIIPCSGCVPTKNHMWDAAYDITTKETMFIPPGEYRTITLDLRVMIPPRWVGLLFGRSGMGTRGIGMVNGVGVIDSGYRGPLKASFHNCSPVGYKIQKGDRVAQLMLVKLPKYQFANIGIKKFFQIDEANPVDTRGVDGLGSTGV